MTLHSYMLHSISPYALDITRLDSTCKRRRVWNISLEESHVLTTKFT